MRGVVFMLTLMALTGCVEEKPSELIGTWVSDGTGAKVRIGADDSCKYFFGSTPGGGMKCEMEEVSKKEARLTFTRNEVFIEASIKRIGTSIFLKTPKGLDILDLKE